MQKNKHFRRIPDYIEQELHNIESQHIVVATIINNGSNHIDREVYRILGITILDGKPVFPSVISPEQLSGLYARRNLNGIYRRLTDLPKVLKTYSIEAPNFGNPEKGYHTSHFSRLVYQRSFEPPRDWELSLESLSTSSGEEIIKVQISSILNRQDPDFNKDLFFAINLLQEQCRDCHVFDANISDEELARITSVGWEIFPPGTIDKGFNEFTRRLRNPSGQRISEIKNRANVISGLNPTEYIVGRGMNSHYYGARFGDHIVVFENVDYGNALYILFDNWQEISRMSRIDILKRHERDFIRIIHKDGWDKTFKRCIDELRSRE